MSVHNSCGNLSITLRAPRLDIFPSISTLRIKVNKLSFIELWKHKMKFVQNIIRLIPSTIIKSRR